MKLNERFGTSLSLLTDLYQLTMANGYFKAGLAERRAVFHLFFRRGPFGGAHAIAAGLHDALDYLAALRFDEDDLAYLATLTGSQGLRLFGDEFLAYLGELRFTGDVDAMPEGTLAFPHEPLLRIEAPLIQGQLIETPLLNLVNFQTLIATKANRICTAAQGDPVLEFGLRRAQGPDGALSASRAAYIGGCAATSNVLAGRLFGIPVRGTHAHAWVMTFGSDAAAFRAYADAMPDNCVFLVDTYDTVEGVKHAITVGRELRAAGHDLLGVRLDSGDLGDLAKKARALLDEAGFPRARVVASNDLDEYAITELKKRGAPIAVWGVGTKLATAYDQPALGGVYKLAAVEDEHGTLEPRIKLSENPIKQSIPGRLLVRRYLRDGAPLGDVIYDVDTPPVADSRATHPEEHGAHFAVPDDAEHIDLLVPVVRAGVEVYERPALPKIRARALSQLASLPAEHRTLLRPEPYPVGLEAGLDELRAGLLAARDEEQAP